MLVVSRVQVKSDARCGCVQAREAHRLARNSADERCWASLCAEEQSAKCWRVSLQTVHSGEPGHILAMVQ